MSETYLEKVLTTDDVIKEAADPSTGDSNYTYDNNGDLNNKVVIINDSGVVDYSLITKTQNSSKGNTLVQNNSNGIIDISLIPASTSGVANTVPKSAVGKTTLDNSWINSIKTASQTATNDKDKFILTNSSGKIDYSLIEKTTTSTPNKLVQTNTSGKINNNLLYTSQSATSGGNALANYIPLSNSLGKIDDAWLVTTNDGSDGNENAILKLKNGKIGSNVIPDGLFIPLTGGEPTGNIIIQGPQTGTSADLNTLISKFPNFYGFGANAYTDGFLIGINSTGSTQSDHDSSTELLIATHDNGNEPIVMRHYAGSQRYANMTNNVMHEIILMDSKGRTELDELTVAGNNETGVIGNITANGVLTINGTTNSTIKGQLKVEKGIIIPINGDKINPTSTYGNAPLTIGNNNSLRIEIDENEIQAKNSNNESAGVNESSDSNTALFLQPDGGLVKIGNNSKTNLHVNGNIRTMNYNTDRGNKEKSEGNLIIVGTSTLTKNVTIGNSSNISTLNVEGNTTIGTSAHKSELFSYGKITANNTLYIPNGSDLLGNSYSTSTPPHLTIGGYNSTHLEIDSNEIEAKTNATTVGTLYLNSDGGTVNIGSNTPAKLVVTDTSFLTGKVTIGTSSVSANLKLQNGMILIDKSGTTKDTVTNIKGQIASNDFWRIASGGTASDSGFLEIATGDNGNEPIYVRQYYGSVDGVGVDTDGWPTTPTRTLTLLDSSGNTIIPGNLTVQTGDSTFVGKVTTGSFKTNGIESTSITNNGTLVSNGLITAGKGLTVNNASLTANNGIETTTLTASGTVKAWNFNGKWGGVINQITTHDKAPDLTRWMLTYVDGYIRYITMSEMADKMKSTINSGIDMTSKAPMPTNSGGVGQVIAGSRGQTYTTPNGGTWEVWGDIHNDNSTANGSIYKVVAGGTTLDAGWFQTKVNWFAKRIQ